jgi:hypothetical protein
MSQVDTTNERQQVVKETTHFKEDSLKAPDKLL